MFPSPFSVRDPVRLGATIDVTRRRVHLRQDPLTVVYELRPDGEIMHVVRLFMDSGGVEHVGRLERSTWGWRPPKGELPSDAREALRLVARAWNKAPLLKR